MINKTFSSAEIQAFRADTPGVSNVIHFNNAGASLIPDGVEKAILEYFQHEVLYGGYETAEKFSSEIDHVYAALSRYLNCSSTEIALCQNATAAWDQAFLSIPFENGDTVLCSISEYASNYIPLLQLAKKKAIQIKAIPNDADGQVDVEALKQLIDKKVKLIAITHVPTNGGLINPAQEIGQISRQNNILYLLDACQSVGQMPLDVKEIGCDFLSGTSRKYLRGPRGIGFLYACENTTSSLEPAILDLHAASWTSPTSYEIRSDAKKYENWENNLSSVVGFATAIDYMLSIGIDKIWTRIQFLATYLRKQLQVIPGVKIHDLGKIKCGIVSFSTPIDSFKLKSELHDNGFNVSVIHPSHTLIDMNTRGLGHLIRASVHYYNTVEEIDVYTDYLKTRLNELE